MADTPAVLGPYKPIQIDTSLAHKDTRFPDSEKAVTITIYSAPVVIVRVAGERIRKETKFDELVEVRYVMEAKHLDELIGDLKQARVVLALGDKRSDIPAGRAPPGYGLKGGDGE